MTPKELAVSILNYLTGKASHLKPNYKDEIITSCSLGDDVLVGASPKIFIEKMENESINNYDAETKKGQAEGTASYDVVYGFDDNQLSIIMNITDVYESVYKNNGTPSTEVVNRKINSVIVENTSIQDVSLDDVMQQLYDYAPIHERVYEAFNTKNWEYVFKWASLENYKNERRKIWGDYIQSKSQPSATLPPFERFKDSMERQLEKYLEQRKPIDFITTFVREQLDTAHLYGMNEKRK
jgi:hypothetical protein